MQSSSEIEIFTLTPSDEPAWQAYVNSHSDATIYHALEWRGILYNEYRFEPVYLIAKKTNPSLSHPHLSPLPEGEDTILLPPLQGEGWGGDGVFSEQSKVIGILPMFLIKNLRGRRLVSLPFSVYGGPVGDTGEVVSALIEKSIEIVRDGAASSLEIRLHKLVSDDAGLVSYEDEIGTTVDLSVGVNELWKRLTDRNDVSRAVREGLKFKLSDGEGIEDFYGLHMMTRKRLGLPTPSLNYYKSFFDKLMGRVKIALVEKEGIPAAGGLFFIYKDVILYALGASDRRYSNCRPSDLLIWEMIKWGCDNGFNILDLGPTPFSDKGLLHFKGKWGGEEEPIKRNFYPAASFKPRDQGGRALFRLMPLSTAKVVGPKVIRYLG